MRFVWLGLGPWILNACVPPVRKAHKHGTNVQNLMFGRVSPLRQARGTRTCKRPRRASSVASSICTSKIPQGNNSKALYKGTNALLTRDFIAKSLYDQKTGYFATKDVINDLPGPLEYRGMLGEMHYRMDVKRAYESKLSAWMTPVETFSPHFSNALAKYVARESKAASTSSKASLGFGSQSTAALDSSQPLILYEAGGGTGTNALNVLNWLRREEPRIYDRTEYTIVEISERLAERQKERVCAVHQNCRVVTANVLEWGLSSEVDPRPCFFLGMELLDNLPHDKIAWVTPSLGPDGEDISCETQSGSEELCEAVVRRTPSGYRESFRQLRDPTISELLVLCPELISMVKNPERSGTYPGAQEVKSRKFFGGALAGLFGNVPRPEYRAAFVPTGALRLVQALHQRLPRHRTILADFDSFAGSSQVRGGDNGGDDESLAAFQAPIVSSRDPQTGEVTDYATYMAELGTVDIFFPTCFHRLSRLHSGVCTRGAGSIRRGRGLVVKQWEFLKEFADLKATRTISGFNPLVDDFRNSSIFISGAVVS